MSAELPFPFARPRLRGVSHQWAALAALAAGIVLVVRADGTREVVGAAIYAASVVALFTTSAVYHRVTWRSAAARMRMRHADHAAIFVLIAGTYTPVALVTLGGSLGIVMLCVIWAGALVGIGIEMFRHDDKRWLTAAVYVTLGWVAAAATPQLLDRAGVGALVLIALGGLLYTGGAVVYARQRPDPVPAVFGYHEVFHALVILAAALHYAAISLWVLG